ENPDHSITTELITDHGEVVIMKATISLGDGVISTGFAEETRGSTQINQTSALENCETSAVGRALAFFGLAGTEIASADEVATAITQQHEKKLFASFVKTTQANEDNHDSLLAVREFLAEDNFDAAREAWAEISDDDKGSIWTATTKGGWLTTDERHKMKTWPSQ
ncbi:unnamed protein product, partial [marine sediment metagenome]